MALSADRNTAHQDGELLSMDMAASSKVYGGSMAAKDATGGIKPAADAANLVVMGMAEEQVDNAAGALGDKTVLVRRGRAFWFKNSATNAATVANIGGNLYVEDDETVSTAGGTNSIVAGKCLAVDSVKGVLIDIN